MKCSVDGCNNPVVARRLCEMHYRRVKRHGSVNGSGFGYGERKNHPLYESWRWQARSIQGRVHEWNDFWRFVKDVGDRPSERYKLFRYKEEEPWGPDNVYWKEFVASTEDAKKYAREWRAKNPIKAKGSYIKRKYGISIEEYDALYRRQKGRCAICGREGDTFNSSDGRSKTLAVDHCHGSMQVRGLLCHMCNKGIAHFNDSPHLLKNAIKYLKRHGAK